VIEKTVRKAERAWFLSRMEGRAKPVSEWDFLAGEIPRVFETPSLIVYLQSRKKNAYNRVQILSIIPEKC
jgi:hypothetical protein